MRSPALVRGGRVRRHSTRVSFPSLKLALFSGVGLVLAGIVMFAVSRETAVTSATSAAAASSRPSVGAARPALSAEEQRYIESLWPIHTQVERAVVRVALGASFYRLHDIDGPELKVRLEQAVSIYSDARARMDAMAPPPSLRGSHDGYLDVLGLFEASANEMLKMFADGSDEHLLVGFPIGLQASDQLRAVGTQLFPEQYPPN